MSEIGPTADSLFYGSIGALQTFDQGNLEAAPANIAAVCHTKESRQKRPFVQPSARGGKVGDSGTSAFNILRELPDVA